MAWTRGHTQESEREVPTFYGTTAKTRRHLAASVLPELTILKRMFTLATQAGKLLSRPYIPMLEERNTRKGFFEPEMFHSVLAHLPAALRPVIEFAYITGWRIPSEVLTLEWRQVDFKAGEVRLDPETTKNREGRVFPITDDLKRLLEAQQQEHLRLKNAGFIVPRVFVRMVARGRNGTKEPRPIQAFTKAWKAACAAAGCPGRIPHDLRRTAKLFVRSHIPKLKEAAARKGFVTPEEYEAIAEELEPQMRPVWQFLYLTGWRVTEALDLRWEHVDNAAAVIRFATT